MAHTVVRTAQRRRAAFRPWLVLVAAVCCAGPLGAQTIGPDLLVPGAQLPPHGSVRIAAQLSGQIAQSYFSVRDGRTELPSGLGGSKTAAAAGLEALYVFHPRAAAFVSWLPGAVFASSFSADDQRRATGFHPLHAGVWLQLAEAGGWFPGGAPGGGGGLIGGPAGLDAGAAFVIAAPFPWPDYEREVERLNNGLSYTPENSGVRAWGVGYLLEGEWHTAALAPRPATLSVHLTHDLLVYLPADYDSSGLREFEENRIWELLENTERWDKIWYRYQLGFSAAPRLRLPTEGGALWRFSLPVAFRYRPEPSFDNNVAVRNTEEWYLSTGVNASVVLPGLARHWELVLDYHFPAAGSNVRSEHLFSVALITEFSVRSEP